MASKTGREPTVVDVMVGNRIRDLRESRAIRQEDLATAIGVSQQQLQKYEDGANRVTAGRLYDAAKFLGSDIPYFFEGLDPLRAAVRRGVAEEGATFAGQDDPKLVELVRLVNLVRDSGSRNSIFAMVRKQAKAAKKPSAKSTK